MGLLHRQMGLCRARTERLSRSAFLSLWLVLTVAPSANAEADAVFDHTQCRRLALTDAATGKPVVGAEAVRRSGDGTEIFVAAYDRRSVDDDGLPPQGGLYAIDLDALTTDEAPSIASLPAPRPAVGGFRPHGLAYHAGNGQGARLAVINRRYVPLASGGTAFHPALEIYRQSAGSWHHIRTVDHDGFCRANNLDFVSPERLVVSVDRSVCADFTVSEDVFGFPGGYLLDVDLADPNAARVTRIDTPLLHFPNGVAHDADRELLYVTATKAATIIPFAVSEDGDGLRLDAQPQIALPGFPDNIAIEGSRQNEAQMIVATFPGLMALAAYRFGWFGTTLLPSRIIRVDARGQVETLFSDPVGELYSAASSAVLVDGHLVAGSIGDRDLLVCSSAKGHGQ